MAAVDVRGAAPGTREVALLAPGMKVETIQALVFAGGSAFGLAAADGVVQELEREGRGHPTPAGVVPIVPAAIIYDLLIGDPAVRPGPAAGVAAYRDAAHDPGATGQRRCRDRSRCSRMAGARKRCGRAASDRRR